MQITTMGLDIAKNGSAAGCCACAATGHAATALPSRVMNSRRLT
jgi:hypothetical protein